MSNRTLRKNEIRDLPFGEQFLLWAIRLWVRSQKHKGDVYATLYEGFRLARLEEGYLIIDEMLTVIGTATTRSIDVRCPQCPGISMDEQTFIGLIAALQQSDFPAGARLLGCWLPPSGVRLALMPAARLARLMAVAGLALRPREIMSAVAGKRLARETERPDVQIKPRTLH